MPDLIILRLHPAQPMSGAEFTAYLTDLTITAYDLSFGDTVGRALLGTASGLAAPHLNSPTNNNVNINTTSILQHYRNVPDPPPPNKLIRKLEAVATAVIVVDPAAVPAEYPTSKSFDIRLELARGDLNIVDHTLEYNVTVVTVNALSTNQTDYRDMAASAFVTLLPVWSIIA